MDGMYGFCNLFVAILAVIVRSGLAGGGPHPIASWVHPVISSPDGSANVTMPEGTLGNTSITVKTSPAATAYVITAQTIPDMFTMYTELGLLAVNEYETDYEQGIRLFYVVIEAEAPDASTATATLTVYLIDVNDNLPIFSSSLYKTMVPETTEAGRDVIGLTVTDADASSEYRSVILSIDDGNTDDLFTIFDDGKIKVAEGKNLYNSTGYYLTVKAADGVNEGFTNVIIGMCEATSTGRNICSTTTVLFTMFLALLFFNLLTA